MRQRQLRRRMEQEVPNIFRRQPLGVDVDSSGWLCVGLHATPISTPIRKKKRGKFVEKSSIKGNRNFKN